MRGRSSTHFRISGRGSPNRKIVLYRFVFNRTILLYNKKNLAKLSKDRDAKLEGLRAYNL